MSSVSAVATVSVAMGADWLDTVKPGWFELVDTDRLDIDSGGDCILGQVFAPEADDDGWWGGGWMFAIDTRLLTVRQSTAWGFGCSNGLIEGQQRKAAWLAAIALRKAG